MAITKSAKKSHKRSLVLRARNFEFKSSMKKAIKNLKKAIAEKQDHGTLMGLLSKAFSAIDKASQKNIIHHKNADRKKHRLNKMVKATVS